MAYGFAAFNNNLNNNLNNNFLSNLNDRINYIISAVRVVSIVLDETHPRFKELGEWSAIGAIEYRDVINPFTQLSVAYPSNIYNQKYPLVNEIVFLLNLPDTGVGEVTSTTKQYYIDSISLWNTPNHNAYPYNPNIPPDSQQKDYQQSSVGNTSKVTSQYTKLYLGKTFQERGNIHPLLPFEGDIITQGRWGNSIRFGSTVPKTSNDWSSVGTSGDPITIIRNGQGELKEKETKPIVEDINNDEASIYLTSTQKIPLNASSTNYFSYKNNAPQSPNQYAGKQVIINSGRLVFNTTEDHLLLSSNKSINLNAVEGVNIDTPTITFQSGNVYIGSKSANEPLLLGNQTVNLLNQLISNLSGFALVCSTSIVKVEPDALSRMNIAATQLVSSLNALQANLNNLKSKYNYTV